MSLVVCRVSSPSVIVRRIVRRRPSSVVRPVVCRPRRSSVVSRPSSSSTRYGAAVLARLGVFLHVLYTHSYVVDYTTHILILYISIYIYIYICVHMDGGLWRARVFYSSSSDNRKSSHTTWTHLANTEAAKVLTCTPSAMETSRPMRSSSPYVQ